MKKQYESYKVVTYFGAPQRRETEKTAMNLADKLRKKGRHGQVEGVWFDKDGMHFDVIKTF